MEKHCESKQKFGKESTARTARNEILERFIQDNGEKAFGFAYRLSGNIDEAKELVQETSYRVMLAWDRYDQSKPLKGWFFTILWNAFLDAQKRGRLKKWIALDYPIDGAEGLYVGDTLSDGGEDIARRLERAETKKAVRHALRRLMPDYRAVIDLWHRNGMSYEAIASSLGIPIGTVRSRIWRGRRALRKQTELAALVE